MKYWQPPTWFRDASTQSMKFFKGGELEEVALMTELEAEIVIPWRAYHTLKQWIIENDADGVIKTDRTEDLKIIHRLLDVVETQSLQGSAKSE